MAGEWFTHPWSADLNWDGWLDLVVPSNLGWHELVWDPELQRFVHTFREVAGLQAGSVWPVYDGTRVQVAAATPQIFTATREGNFFLSVCG